MKKLFLCVLCFLIGFSILLNTGSVANAWKPTKTITWIVHYGPGGGFDLYSRAIAPIMSKNLGVNVVIKNIPGGASRIGTNALYRARPEGHTVGLLNMPALIAVQAIQKTKFDLKKFTYLGEFGQDQYVLIAAAQSPFKTIADLRKAAANRPLRVAVTDKTGGSAINAAISLRALGIPYIFVPGYASSAAYTVGVIRGDADLTLLNLATALPFVKAGDIRVILFYGLERSELYPDVPSAKEVGQPEIAECRIMRALAAPPKTPDNIANVLADALWKSLHDPKITAWAKKNKRPLYPKNREAVNKSAKIAIQFFEKWAEALK